MQQTQDEFQDEAERAIVAFAMNPDSDARLNAVLPSYVRFDLSVDEIATSVAYIVKKRLMRSEWFADGQEARPPTCKNPDRLD